MALERQAGPFSTMLTMFIAEEIVAAAGFDAAVSRLTHVINHGVLRAASLAAYEDGQTALLRVGPAGEARGVSKLVRVRFLEPVRRGATLTVAVRWEATGPAGSLFPVLDADLILAREGEEEVRLGLSGSYRPPLGRVGAALDRTVLHEIATATVHSLLRNVGHAIADPEPGLQPRTSQEPARPQLTPEEA
jgi:hypothetical protein